ncbi:hypothetical protein PtA15_13A421 [Puccinia triticina]|uniref:phosphatidylinositol-3,4,5-trisphosphate 3-phosphatase n=2 Tax=Puccinia triticina TaxID=208348 RepID=A0ABY7D0R9_9BASI|nr:uncharacterized protein PtA15_13A421 [Puccinia triticina]WAQ91021.1 hypothetical protein PtA15_13A421 [Puccinia triticina]
MNLNAIRKLVSGNKTRLKDAQVGVELDLCYLTPQIILMGFPASGIETLYRNSRKQVKRWLEARHALAYRIYNFCPLTENGYDSAYFHHQVHRFPFPDHHPPPLSMIPLFVADMAAFLAGSSANVAVIHCKAGKGRSGTMSISYLMTLDAVPEDAAPARPGPAPAEAPKPRPPELVAPAYPPPKAAPSATAPYAGVIVANRATIADALIDLPAEGHDADGRLQLGDAEGRGGIATPDAGDADKTPTVPAEGPTFGPAPATNGARMRARIGALLRYHTARRMADPSASRDGVSIPSQRRWLEYWGAVLAGNDARRFLDQPAPKHVVIKWIKIRLTPSEHYLNLVSFNTKIAVQLAHYKSSYIDRIERAEQALHRTNGFPRAQFLAPSSGSSPAAHPGPADAAQSPGAHAPDSEWQDGSALVVKFASFGQRPAPPSSASSADASVFDGSSSVGTHSSTTSGRPGSVSTDMGPGEAVWPARRAADDEEDGSSRLLTPVRLYPSPESATSARGLARKAKGRAAIDALGGVRLDATREVQCKFVVGSTGSKHASLMTDVVSLGYLWFIPAFHANDPASPAHPRQPSASSSAASAAVPDASSSSTSSFDPHHHHHHHHHQGEHITTFDNHQIDFCHLNLLSNVQICWHFSP